MTLALIVPAHAGEHGRAERHAILITGQPRPAARRKPIHMRKGEAHRVKSIFG
jgi:hypothetical protein